MEHKTKKPFWGNRPERSGMIAAMHLLRQVHGAMNKPHNPPPSKKEGALTE